MSSIASLSSAPSALSSMTARAHGHKKGSRVESPNSDSGGDAMTPVPAATQQNLFSSMLQSLEQVIGVQPATATAAAPVANSAATGSAAGAAHSTAAPASTTASSTGALQKYLHNVSSQSDDLRLPTAIGSNVSANA
jgi:hypothetical protein